jgi:hypothetical protein
MKKGQTKKWSKPLRVQARVNVKEMQEILAKAHLYTLGNVSDYARKAMLEYKPIKKVEK